MYGNVRRSSIGPDPQKTDGFVKRSQKAAFLEKHPTHKSFPLMGNKKNDRDTEWDSVRFEGSA